MTTQAARPSLAKASFMVLTASLLFFYEFGLTNIYNSLGYHIAAEFNLSPTVTGLVASLFFYMDLLFLIPAGLLLDRYSPRKIISLVLLIAASAVLMMSLAHSLFLLVLSRLLMGIGGGFCFVGCMRVAVNWLAPKYLARATGVIVTVGMLGGWMVQAPLTMLINQFGWREALVIVAFIGYGVMLLVFLWVRDYPKESLEQGTAMPAPHILHSLKWSLLSVQNWCAAIYTGFMNLPIFMLGALWGIPYLMQVQHFTNTHAAEVSGMLYLGTMIGSPLMGWLSDSIGRRKAVMQVMAVFAIVLIEIIINVKMLTFANMLLLFLLLGFITSAQIISYPLVVESNTRRVSGSALSVISMMCMGTGALIQPLFGYLLSYHGGALTTANHLMVYPAASYQFAMEALPVAFVIALAVTFVLKETYCRAQVD